MNKYDSELLAGLLEAQGYLQAGSPDEADTVIVNTCSVREHAESRALGRIRVLAGWRKKAPGRRLGVVGCMAQRMSAELRTACPDVDFILGPDAYRSLPAILGNGRHGPVTAARPDHRETYGEIVPRRSSGISAWIAVMRGCDNYCSYCIVPYTRGRERSRPESEILKEFRAVSESGYREVTLLGQNVNSYRDGGTDFAGLLGRIARADRRIWIRFMTSHPKDMSDVLLDTIAGEPNVCPHIHLPVQSGSDRILKRMNRKYTRAHYLDLVDKIRRRIGGAAVTTDVMVGFPGETENDFGDTVSLLRDVRFDEAYMYHYSVRPGTRAARMRETLTLADKLHRLDEIIRLQRRISLEIRQSMIGKRVVVLPEGRSKKNKSEWMGKTPAGHVVVFSGQSVRPGEPVSVKLDECRGATPRGRRVPSNR